MQMNKKEKDAKESIKELVASKLENLSGEGEEGQENQPELQKQSEVSMTDENHIQIENQTYEITINYREGFNLEAMAQRYNSILNKYDYIVGDWGYDQLRLKGFFQDSNNRAPFDKKISFLEDYLYEYCNFGCAYFVLEKEKSKKTKNKRKRRPKKEEIPDGKNNYQTDHTNRKKRSRPRKQESDGRREQNEQQQKNFVIKKTDKNRESSTKQEKKELPNRKKSPKMDFHIHQIDEKDHNE